MIRQVALIGCALSTVLFSEAGFGQTKTNKFQQLDQENHTPNVYRTASGAPGHAYYQNRADYEMQIELDDEHQRVSGTETVTYLNNSPDELTYLWVQLDQNQQARDSDTKKIATGTLTERMNFTALRQYFDDFEGGIKIEWVRDRQNQNITYTVNKTMMRVELPVGIKSKGSVTFKVKWSYNINDRLKLGGRSGYEYFAEDSNYVYTIAQFFPRMAVYNEVYGWQNKQFLGSGEFTLPFGNYTVSLTVPSDHVVAATGVLQNPKEALTAAQQERLAGAKTASDPVLIVTAEEALAAEKKHAMSKKTLVYHADNVRDFAFASSRKFIWDAMGVKIGPNEVMAMSVYPREGNPLWGKYSTRVVAHTLQTYSKYTFNYPYPSAISVHTDRIGMEYPMICFNGGRPEKDGTYSDRTKYGMISVIIHEVGHNFFPMIVNSDERQWTWMDEGLNTFLQYLTEQEWERDYPSNRGPAHKIVDYMKGDQKSLSPIMTNSESVFQLGANAYAKTATGLNILRETIMGRELFDYAFRTYAQRWMFKSPTPEDFFRTMEDASAVDLDWFWRGWFYGTDPVDMALKEVKWYEIDTKNPDFEKPLARTRKDEQNPGVSALRNRKQIKETVLDQNPEMSDFYNKYDPYEVSLLDKEEYDTYLSQLSEDERIVLESSRNFYQLTLENRGGMVAPVILKFEYEDGTDEIQRIPAEIWRLRQDEVSKVFVTEKKITRITLDPLLETADIDVSNNIWPPQAQPTRFQLFKDRQAPPENPMQKQKRLEQKEQDKKPDPDGKTN